MLAALVRRPSQLTRLLQLEPFDLTFQGCGEEGRDPSTTSGVLLLRFRLCFQSLPPPWATIGSLTAKSSPQSAGWCLTLSPESRKQVPGRAARSDRISDAADQTPELENRPAVAEAAAAPNLIDDGLGGPI